ncbi:hypothetical protein GCM10027443_32970 [Pontibacter brevis]
MSGSGDYAKWLKRLTINEKLIFGNVVGVEEGKMSKATSASSNADHFLVVSMSPIV